MRWFKNLKQRWLVALTILAAVMVALAGFKLYQDHKAEALLNFKVTAKASDTTTASTLKTQAIHQFTDDDLVKYRRLALQKHVDRYPNGYLEIPSASIKLPIYNRANNLTLSLGVGKSYYLDSKFGQGNVVLAGHNMERNGVLLSNLGQTKIGGEVSLVDAKQHRYHYRVVTKKVMSPYVKLINGHPVKGSAYYLPSDNEKPLVTIYTCANHGRTRLVVQAQLQD